MNFNLEKDDFCKKALFWIQSKLQEFDPSNTPVNNQIRLKALSELLFICYLYKRRFKTLSNPLDNFLLFGRDIVVQKLKYSDRIHRKQELVLPYSIIYKSLSECGTRLQNLKDVIQSMLDLGLPMASDDNPYRKMELRYSLEGQGFRNLPPTIWSLYRGTSFYKALQNSPPILSLGLDQVYGLTHLVFYLTNFGFSRRKIPHSTTLCWLVSVQLGLQALEKNWDAVAELLMCCKFLRYFPSSLYKSAWRSLIEAQKPDGSLTDNLFDARRFERMSGPEKDRYYFEQHYHTTTVCAAAAFLTDAADIERSDPLYVATSPSLNRRVNYTNRLTHAHNWLCKTYEDLSAELELSSLLQILIGEWMSSLSLDRRHHPERLQRISWQIRDDITRALRDCPTAVDVCDPALIFIGQGILRRFDAGVSEFENLANESAKALKGNVSVIKQEPRLFPVLHLLESLDFKFGRTEMLDESIIIADYKRGVLEEKLLRLVNYISKVTSFGSIGFKTESGFADAIKADLIALSYHRLSHYNLDEALMLIRAMNYAGMDCSKPFKEAISYVLAQQREDGSFGFYADEIELIKESDSKFDPLQKIILPTTVAAIWTLSEAMKKDVSLFGSIRSSTNKWP
jgi:hypothetical protein